LIDCSYISEARTNRQTTRDSHSAECDVTSGWLSSHPDIDSRVT